MEQPRVASQAAYKHTIGRQPRDHFTHAISRIGQKAKSPVGIGFAQRAEHVGCMIELGAIRQLLLFGRFRRHIKPGLHGHGHAFLLVS